MSALEQLREAVSAPHNLVQYDTDTVSVTSTVDNEEETIWYNAECIVAERDNENECYLVKWEDYPLDQCKDILRQIRTWEPPEHLDGTDLITKWKQVEEEFGKAAFLRENENNIKVYHKAKRAAELATAHEGRRTASGLSVNSTANARPTPTHRQAPVQQSSLEEESSSEMQVSDAALLGDLRRKKTSKEKADQREARKGLDASTLQTKYLPKATAPEAASGEAAVPDRGPQRVKVSAVTTEITFPPASGHDRSVVTATSAQQITDNTVSKLGGRAIRTAQPKQTSRAINFVDEPREKRKQWSNTDKQFNKLRFRGLAEKRSRAEATPDFGELSFVNNPSPSLPKAVSNPNNDPYARRDITTRRIQEEDPDDQPRFRQDAGPLTNWEKDKVPMMCNAWKLSSNCVYGAQGCRFMHRTHDPEGRPYQLGDIHNRVPQKYRKPPITCEYWFDGNRCKKPAEECLYAHEDTGWTEVNGKPIEREHVAPNSARPAPRDAPPHLVPFKLQNPPITCHYWLRDPHGCRKSEAICKYAHWNTGWAPPELDLRGPPVEVDPHLQPRGMTPKDADLPVTCPYWLRAETGCTRPDEECRFAHRNTGWINLGPGHYSKLEQIDPQKTPRFRKIDPTEGGSARNGHVTPSSRGGPFKLANEPGLHIFDHSFADISPELVRSPVAVQDALPDQVSGACNTSQLNARTEKFYNLNIADLFLSGIPGDDRPLERRAMLLYHPQEHREEIELIAQWLLMHEVQISNLWYDGAWDQFTEDVSEGKSGVIIAHPDFQQYVELSGFGEVLKQRTRVWSVGLQPPPEYEFGVSSNPPELQYDRVGIFPHGGFVYITGDVFEQKPQLVLNIVKQFFTKIELLRSLDGPASPWLEVYDACLLWRLCVRPELMDSLYQKCEENSAELAAQNPDYLSRAELYQLLTSTNYIEQDHPTEPLSLVQDRYPILSERRVIAEHPPLDYFNRLANSQEDADTHMIGYYAAMQSADLRRAYRYFYIVHTEPEADCAKEWKASIHNIASIITPEQCIEELSKPSKESIFDFLDWAMEPKKKPLEVVPEQDLGNAAMEMSSPTKEIPTGPAAR
ncbi:hypothetical protein E8E12_003248 [Didymella heteroderae]|uniref:Metal ion binding n=1 Tax=Didymella heteroderae TaxID=1769908 RepID=A0A9P4WTU3_9PLEO|nr:hypothetical protein E8E12_003248 [Didymella heteroderae]